jgi:uncharacterized membrane protein
MELVKRKIWKLPLIIWFLIMLFVGVAIGTIMYTLVIPGTITIEPPAAGTYEIQVYSDAEATQELTSFDFGTVKAGDSVTFSCYIKNLGDTTIPGINLRIDISGLISAQSPDIVQDLAPGEIRYVSRTFSIPGDAGAGTYSVEIVFEVYA